MPENVVCWEECTEAGKGWGTACPKDLMRLSAIRLTRWY